jgi:hypothetical protein
MVFLLKPEVSSMDLHTYQPYLPTATIVPCITLYPIPSATIPIARSTTHCLVNKDKDNVDYQILHPQSPPHDSSHALYSPKNPK